MADRAVLLVGFEGALAQAIADRFRFSGETLKNLALAVGRHLFVQDHPSSEDIKRAHPTFNSAVEPTIALYTGAGPKAMTSSSSGGRHEFFIELVARLPQANESTKILLEELVTKIEKTFEGIVAGDFLIKRAKIEAAPHVIARLENDQVLVSSTMRFFAVPMPQ